MAGPVAPADVRISTGGIKRLLQYEPRDLTVSVESGMPFTELNSLLARNGQMIPLDGPYGESATVGGMVAANISGARRRLYGTARDLVIGMNFATLDGKVVQSGGMVVKNVAGLDMGKLIIGSFGTLAAIASVNFKLTPRPAVAQTILFTFEDLPAALEARNSAIRGVLNPVAVEILNPILSAQVGLKNFTLAILFAGNEAVIERSIREASALGPARPLAVEERTTLLEFHCTRSPRAFSKKIPRRSGGVRLSTTLTECGEALGERGRPRGTHMRHPASCAAGSPDRKTARRCVTDAVKRGWKTVVEFSSESARPKMTLWPEPGGDFAIMKEIKRMFDPENLLNRGRLFGQL